MSLFEPGCDCAGICGGDCPEWRRAFRNKCLMIVVVSFWVASVLVLTGCGVPAPVPVMMTEQQVERVALPQGLLQCQGEPKVTGWAIQSQVADYIVRLREAYQDCHNDVAAIAQIENSPPVSP